MKSLIVFSLLIFSQVSLANNYGFTNLSQGDVDNIFKEFSATFGHSTVTGATSHSKIFGFEMGVLAGVTKSEHIKDLVAQTLPPGSDEVNFLPFASLYSLVSLPLGITAEANFTPEIDIQGVEFRHLSLAGKWEVTSVVTLPFKLAVRGFLVSTQLAIEQTSSGSSTFTGEVEFEQTQTGLQVIAGEKYGLLEPYVGVGLVRSSGDLKATGSGTIFNSAVTLTNSAKSDATSLQAIGGLQLNLLLVKTGIEYVHAFGASHLNAKVALSF